MKLKRLREELVRKMGEAEERLSLSLCLRRAGNPRHFGQWGNFVAVPGFSTTVRKKPPPRSMSDSIGSKQHDGRARVFEFPEGRVKQKIVRFARPS